MTQDIENLIQHLPDDIISIGVRLNGDADEALALVRRIIDASVVHLGLESAKLNDLYLAFALIPKIPKDDIIRFTFL